MLVGLLTKNAFSITPSCDIYCANFKTCFFLGIIFLLTLTTIALFSVQESSIAAPPAASEANASKVKQEPSSLAFILEISVALRQLNSPMWMLLLVTCLNWVAWFPFPLDDTCMDGFAGKVQNGEVKTMGLPRVHHFGLRCGFHYPRKARITAEDVVADVLKASMDVNCNSYLMEHMKSAFLRQENLKI